MTDVRDCVYEYIERVDELEDENEQLKELLQECRNRLDTYYSDLIKKIDEVLNDQRL